MTRTTQITILIVLLGLLSLFYQGLWGDPRHIPPILIGTKAPIFEGPDVESGEPLSSKKYQGKVILVNFWASWCQECKVEHNNLLKLYDEFKDHPEFIMLGINYQDEIPKARAYLKQYGSSFPHVRDVKGALAIDFGVYGVPETFVIVIFPHQVSLAHNCPAAAAISQCFLEHAPGDWPTIWICG